MGLPARFKEKVARLLPAQSLRARFAKGIFWSVTGTGISQLFQFAAIALTARILGKTVFGELGMVNSTIGMFGVFAGLGLGLTATKHVAEFRTDNPRRAGRIIGMCATVAVVSGGVLSVALFIAAPYLARYTINAPHLTIELRIACGLLFFNALNGAQIGALAGLEAFRTIAKANFLRGILSFPLIVVGVYFWGLRGAVCAISGVAAIAWVINHIALRIETRKASIRASYRPTRQELALLWRFSLPTVLGGMLYGPVMWAAQAILANQENGYSEIGVFSAANRFNRILMIIGGQLGVVLLPMLASKGGSESARFQRGNMLISWMVGIGASLPLICFPEILSLIFGGHFAGFHARVTLVLIVYWTCIQLYKQGLGRILTARGMMWWGFFGIAVWAAVFLTCVYGLKQYGSMALAFSLFVGTIASTVFVMPLCIRWKMVPRGTLVSVEATAIWLILAALAALALLDVPLYARAGAFVVCLWPLYAAFRRLFAGGEKQRPVETEKVGR